MAVNIAYRPTLHWERRQGLTDEQLILPREFDTG